MAFSATIDNEIVTWSREFGLLGFGPYAYAITRSLDGSEITPFGPGPTLKLDDTNPYAVVWAISQVYPKAVLSGNVPDFADILGPIDPDAIY